MANAATLSGPDLRRLRRLREVSQADVARVLGVSRARVQQVETAGRLSDLWLARYLAALEALAEDERS